MVSKMRSYGGLVTVLKFCGLLAVPGAFGNLVFWEFMERLGVFGVSWDHMGVLGFLRRTLQE